MLIRLIFLLSALLCACGGRDLRLELDQAARKGDLDQLQAALAAGVDPAMQLEDNGRQAIHLAAWKGHLEMVRTLVEKYSVGVDERAVMKPHRIVKVEVKVDSTTRQPLPGPEGTLMTPLMETVNESRMEVARYLLDTGADVHAQDRYGSSALMFTVYSQDAGMADLLISYGASVSGICGF